LLMGKRKKESQTTTSHNSQAMEPPRQITLLLSFYLQEIFSNFFEGLGFSVLWAETREKLEELIDPAEIDLAIEWQHGEKDFTIRDLLRNHNKKTQVFLALNWNGKIPPDFNELGYAGVLIGLFNLDELKIKFYNSLSAHKKSIFKELPIWKSRVNPRSL